ncbi:Ig-like domain-containing protein [Chloroflexota bacterium]
MRMGITRRLIIGLLIALLIIGLPGAAAADEVVLRPGYISGAIQVGNAPLSYCSLNASWSSYSASTSIYPNNATSATYNLTVNVPEGQTPNYNVSANVYLNGWRDTLYFGSKSVSVTEYQTSTADFVLANPGYIQATVTASGGVLSSASFNAYQSSTTAYTSSSSSAGSSGTVTFAVVPNDNIRVYGSASVAGTSISFPNQYVAVSAGETVEVDWSVTYTPPETGNIEGTIEIDGPVAPDRHYVYTSGPSSANSNIYSNPGSFSFSDLKVGSYYMYSYTYFNSNDDYLQYPYGAYSPNRQVSLTAGATESVDIHAEQAFINGNLLLEGTATLDDVNSANIYAYGVSGTDSYGGSAYDKIDLQTGDYDLVVSNGDWRVNRINMNLSRPSTHEDGYLSESLNFTDYTIQNDYVSLAAGETGFRDFGYGVGSVTITFHIEGGGLLSNPRLDGRVYKRNDANQTEWYYNFNSYSSGQNNVEEGVVTFVGMGGVATVNAWATVGGSNTKFGELTVEVVPGAVVIIDIGGPAIDVDFPEPGYVTPDESITVTGMATDDVSVASVTVNGVEASFTPTGNPDDENEVSFSATIPLVKGANDIETIATDTSDKAATDTRTIFRDDGPPVVEWIPDDGSATSLYDITIEGTATDDNGIYSIKVNGVTVPFQLTGNPDDPNEVSFSTLLTLVDGENSIEVVVTDISKQTASEVHLVTVSENQPPVAVDDTYMVDEDNILSVDAPGVLGNDTDADNDPLTAVNDSDPANGSVTFNSDGSFTYTPNGNYNGTDSFTYHANDGTVDSEIATVSITVNPVNDAPVAADDSASTNEDTAVTIPVLENDSDIDSSTIAVEDFTQPASGTVTNNGDSVTFDPNGQYESLAEGETDTATFSYTVSDGNNGTDTATVTVTINGVNDAPVANIFTVEDASIALPVTMKVTPQTLNVERLGNWVKVHLLDDSENTPQEMEVTLNGSGSYDVDGDEISYTWLLVGPEGEVDVSDDAIITISLPAGTYTAKLVVSDGIADSTAVAITFTLTNQTIADLLAVAPENYTLNGVPGSEVKGDGNVVISFADDAIAETVEVGLDVEMLLEGTASGVDYIDVIQDKENGNGKGKSDLKEK